MFNIINIIALDKRYIQAIVKALYTSLTFAF